MLFAGLLATAAGTAGEFRLMNSTLMITTVIGIVLLPAVADGTFATVARVYRDRVGSPVGVDFLPNGRQRTSSDNDAILIQPTHRCWPVTPLHKLIAADGGRIERNELIGANVNG